MVVISDEKQLETLTDNYCIGCKEISFKGNTKIVFKGKHNILCCEENVVLDDTTIIFAGNNSLIYLSSSKRVYKLNVAIRHNSVFFSGEDNYFNKPMEVVISEQKNIFLGNDSLFSYGLCLRTADPHIVYDALSKKRLNLSKSIYIGDHVWIGQEVLILKGSQIGSGSIIGGKAVIPGKRIPSNTSWGGNPARQLRDNVFFINALVHSYQDEDTRKSMAYESEEYVFRKDKYCLAFDTIEIILTQLTCAEQKLDFIKKIRKYTKKNRFFIGDSSKRTKER